MNTNVINGFRLSQQQRRLWMLRQGAAYRAQCALLLEGRLDHHVLRKAMQDVVDQNEILRTRFYRESGMKAPVQVIETVDQVSWRVETLNGKKPGEREERITELWEEEAVQCSRSNEAGTVTQLVLVQLSAQQHVLLICMPALCADGWAIGKFIEKIKHQYGVRLGVEELPDEPLQYVDYSDWQSELLEEETAREGSAFWENQGLSEIAPIRLPFEICSPAEKNFNPACFVTFLVDETKAKLERYELEHGTPLPELLHAAWLILLHRLSNASDLLTGLVAHGRTLLPLQDAIGLFAQTLPLRLHLSSSDSFSSILSLLGAAGSRALKWQQYCQLDRLLPDSGSSDPPSLPFVFEHERRLSECEFGPELRLTLLRQYACSDRCQLKLNCVLYQPPTGQFLNGSQPEQTARARIETEFHFDPRVFSREATNCLAEQFQCLLAAAVEDPGLPVARLPLGTASERELLLRELNDSARPDGSDLLVHQL